MGETGVEFEGVSYTLPSVAPERTLLRDIYLKLEAGTTTALLGRSGSGKTTLLRMVNGLVMPSAGTVRVLGKTTREWNLIKLRHSIGYVIQETGLFPHMTIDRNSGLALEIAGKPEAERKRRAAEGLTMTGLDPLLSTRYPWQLSGGQRQRVGLARAMATDPYILLMDEPFGALDPITRAEMQTMLKALLDRVRKTVLLVTHDLDEALYLASRIIFLVEGQIVADLAPQKVNESQNEHVKSYVAAVHRTVPA